MINPKTLDEAIEYLLLYMSLSKTRPLQNGKFTRFHDVPIGYFDGARPFMFMDKFYTKETESSQTVFLGDDIRPDTLDRNLDICFINGEHECGDYDFYVQRRKRVDPKKYRGLIKKMSPYIIEVSSGIFDINSETCKTSRLLLGYFPKRDDNGNCIPYWLPCFDVSPYPPKHEIESENSSMQWAISMQFTDYYNWRVYLGWEGCPGISFVTDPVGAREAFRLRDIPDGRQRRAALRNWVKEHYRKLRNDPAEKRKVVEHLRGATQFNWSGLKCKITPSQSDLDKLESIKNGKKMA